MAVREFIEGYCIEDSINNKLKFLLLILYL